MCCVGVVSAVVVRDVMFVSVPCVVVVSACMASTTDAPSSRPLPLSFAFALAFAFVWTGLRRRADEHDSAILIFQDLLWWRGIGSNYPCPLPSAHSRAERAHRPVFKEGLDVCLGAVTHRQP